MEKWKKNKRHLSEKRTTKFDFWKRREAHKKDTTGKHTVVISFKTVGLTADMKQWGALMLSQQY